MARPYQPSLLRLLHGLIALLAPLAWLTGFLVYNRYDGRWGRLPLLQAQDWADLHGTVGVLLWPLALLFGLYALGPGGARLRRPVNALALLALALAVASGKLMQEEWLRQGQLHHWVYSLHLLSWLLIAVAVLCHVCGVLRLGGLPLARSMFHPAIQRGDQPGDWPSQLTRWWHRGR